MFHSSFRNKNWNFFVVTVQYIGICSAFGNFCASHIVVQPYIGHNQDFEETPRTTSSMHFMSL